MNGGTAGLRMHLQYFLLAVVLLFFGFPVVWTVLTSIKPLRLIPKMPPAWIFMPTLDHYGAIFTEKGLHFSLWNSVVVAATSTLLAILIGAPAAYAFSRFRFRGKESLAFYFLTSRMAPPLAVVLPFFLISRDLGLLDTKLVLIVAYTTFNFSFVVWLLRGFFAEIPTELDEAALVDGCSRFGAFRRVVLPLARPGLVACAIICFIFSWNEFLFALILTNLFAKTLPVMAAGFVTDRLVLWGNLCASAVVIYVPVMLLALLTRRHLIRGMTMGAIR